MQDLPKIVVPQAKRNIFINDKRFYLNVPELTFFWERSETTSMVNFRVWIVKNYKLYHVPLPNIYINGKVCLGTRWKRSDFDDCIERFFSSRFAVQVSSFPRGIHSLTQFPEHGSLCYYVDTFSLQQPIINQNDIDTLILKEHTLQFYFNNLIAMGPI